KPCLDCGTPSTGTRCKSCGDTHRRATRNDYQRRARANGRIPSSTQQGYDSDRKSTRLNSSHVSISYAVFCLRNNIILFSFADLSGRALSPIHSAPPNVYTLSLHDALPI